MVIMGRIRQILLILDTAREPNRQFIRGITRYANHHGPWIFHGIPPLYHLKNIKLQDSAFFKDDFITADAAFGYIDDKIAEVLKKQGKPIANIFIKKNLQGAINIQEQKNATGQMGAKHFLDLGLKNFAFCGWKEFDWSDTRQKGFCLAIVKAGFKATSYKEPASGKKLSRETRRKLLIQWLASLPKPVGIMTCNDDRSREIVEACLVANLDIPEDVAVIGVDNDRMVCNLSLPPLSSIAMSHEQAGYRVGQLLDAMMTGKTVKDKQILIHPLYLQHRQSTDILAIDDKEIVTALHFIRDNSSHQITVQQVADEATLSIRVLQLRFRKILDRSIHQEIRRVRIERFCKMLIETDLSIYQIAASLEFRDVNHVARAFRKEKGMTPLQYRKRLGY